MADGAAAKRSLGKLVVLAGVAGLAAGVGVLYMTGAFSGNRGVAAECRAAAAVAERLVPHARGEVAAFLVERSPTLVPNLTFRNIEGRELRLDAFRGRTVLLNLWATWCAPCRHEMPALDRLQATLGGPAFEVVAVSIDLGAADKPRAFYTETGIQRLAFFQDPSGRVFQELRAVGRAVGMPTTLLLDPAGCILGHLSGPAEWSSDDALRLVRTVLPGA
jgi:thiol-disulfide isomerase/thioredoxin